MSRTYELAKEFKRKYPLTISFRTRMHCSIIDKHLNPDEKVLYVFLAQKNDNAFDFTNTYVIALTNHRLMLGTKRLLFGYFFYSITPDMFNDLTVKEGLLWGRITIDTVKEEVSFSNISKSALPEIETNITKYMMEEKKKFRPRENHSHRQCN